MCTVVEAIVAFLSVWSVIGLAGFHSYLVCCNITTNEDVSFLSNSASYPQRDGKWAVACLLCHTDEGLVWPVGVMVCLLAAPHIQLSGNMMRRDSRKSRKHGSRVFRVFRQLPCFPCFFAIAVFCRVFFQFCWPFNSFAQFLNNKLIIVFLFCYLRLLSLHTGQCTSASEFHGQ